MKTYKLSRKHALLLALFFILLTAQSTVAYIVMQTGTLKNIFVPVVHSTGDLTISKTIEHSLGESYIIPDDIAFDFRINLGMSYADQAIATTQGTIDSDENGIITVTVKPEIPITIQGIDAGTTVTVTEQEKDNDGFTVKDEQFSKEITIREGENIAAFVNAYAPSKVSPVNVTVTGTKNLEGRDWKEGDSFTFRLDYHISEDETDDWTVIGTGNVTYDLDDQNFNHFDFTEMIQAMDFSQAGTYAFRLSEIRERIGGFDYENVVSYFDIKVGDKDMDGSLEIQGVTTYQNAQVSEDKEKPQYNIDITLTNQYVPAGTAETIVNICKTMDDQSGQNKTPADFSFALYLEDGSLVKESAPTSAAGGTGIRLTYDASLAGQTFTYILKEKNGGQTINGVTYDASEYKFWVSVIDNLDGTVSAVISDTDPNNKNTVSGGNAGEVTCGNSRESSGGTVSDGNVGNVSDGNAGTNGENEKASNIYTATFRNTYDPQDATLTLTGKKVLTGRAMKPAEFTFNLYEAAADFMIPENAEPVQTADNDADGNFTFAPLTFDKVGTYRYIVTEDPSAKLGGITYDDTKYLVTVMVTDNNGVLEAVPIITTTSGEVSEITFRNTYKPAKVILTLAGTKVLKGAALTDGMFRFSLGETDANFTAPGNIIQTASNAPSGNFVFDTLTYTEAGTYYYIIAEEKPEQPDRITYDDTVYRITVNVEDNGEGQLAAAASIVKADGDPTDIILFENTYTPRPDDIEVTIGVKKTVKNIGTESIGPEGFEFILENTDAGAKSAVTSDKDGKAAYTLAFTEEDAGNTYNYRLTETNAGREYVNYSALVYNFRISITLDTENRLSATVWYNGKPVDGFTAEFENIYDKNVTEEPGGSEEPDVSEQPEESEEPSEQTTSSAKTGDDSALLLYIFIACVSIPVVVLLLIKKHRK